MGLDQHALARRPGVKALEEFAYWRKHPNLHGWMEQLWNEKGGEGEFNRAWVHLTVRDLDELERLVRGSDLPKTVGFFSGSNSDEYYADQDLEFIRKARNELEDGNEVIYWSWW